jgi:uncharacterized membrane protein YoaK (UPF0700 family)
MRNLGLVFPSLKSVPIYHLLSFNAGCINAGGFLATGKFVSHVTGFATFFGVDFVDDRPESAIGILSVPFFFLVGSFISGVLIDRRIFLRKVPHYDYVMGLSALCLLLAGADGVFVLSPIGRFGQLFKLENVYILISLLCLACGLQNGAITTSSGSAVRTTHLTGITTDLGLGLAKICIRPRHSKLDSEEIRRNLFRVGTIFAFITGSAVGTYFFTRLGYSGFFVPSFIMSFVAYLGRVEKWSQSTVMQQDEQMSLVH